MTMTATAMVDLTVIAKQLGFVPCDGGLYAARIRGYPAGLKFLDPAAFSMMLFHIRHLSPADPKKFSAINYAPDVARLVEDKEIEIELDDRIAWITIYNAAEKFNAGTIPGLLDSITGSFIQAGLPGNSDLCHYCQHNHIETLTCHDGKVTQICSVCLDERLQRPENRPVRAAEGAVPVAVLGSLAALVGAVGWAVGWFVYDRVIDFLERKFGGIPHLVDVMLMVIVILAAGWPVGFAIKRIRRRGQGISKAFAVICGICAVVLGEVFFVAWLIYSELQVFSFEAAGRILPQVEAESGPFLLALKIVAAIGTVVLAAEMSKPPKSTLKL